jgi:hypothetical protein
MDSQFMAVFAEPQGSSGGAKFSPLDLPVIERTQPKPAGNLDMFWLSLQVHTVRVGPPENLWLHPPPFFFRQ